MKNLIGLLTLLSVTVGNAYSQTESKRRERIEFDTVIGIGGGRFHFHLDMDNAPIGGSGKNANGNYNNAKAINNLESEQKRREKEWRAIEEYIDSMRVVLFNNFLGITKEKAVVFWPAYNDYRNRLNRIMEKRKEASDKLCDPFRKYKIKEYAAFVDMEVKSYMEEALLREQYAEKFKTILGESYYLFYRAEYLFIKWIYSNF
ncbi:MAG: hypothetical protein LBQ01_02395 [Prevotellaceae bacterium]|jgi:hypothetical protein|nr:hypothetical protein [Prevotellaceae bacterium]